MVSAAQITYHAKSAEPAHLRESVLNTTASCLKNEKLSFPEKRAHHIIFK